MINIDSDMSTDASVGGSESVESLMGKRKKKKEIQETKDSQ